MNKRMILGTLLVASCSLNSQADDLKYLTVHYNNVEKSLDLATVQKLTFEDSNVIVWTSEGQVAFPLSEMQKMTFTATATAINSLPEQSESLQMQEGKLCVKDAGILRVYNTAGALVRIARVEKGETEVSLESLTPGVYVVTLGKQTIKVLK